MLVSAIRAAIEDYRRHTADEEENSKLIDVLTPSMDFDKTKSESILVGNIVKIYKNQMIPADILCLFSSNLKGFCFVETASIDGETGLKTKSAINEIQTKINSFPDINSHLLPYFRNLSGEVLFYLTVFLF